LIICRTHIGWRSTKQDTAGVHGSPLGAECLAEFKQKLGYAEDDFVVRDEVGEISESLIKRGATYLQKWQTDFAAYRKSNGSKALELARVLSGQLPKGWQEALPKFEQGEKLATRVASGKVLENIAGAIPELKIYKKTISLVAISAMGFVSMPWPLFLMGCLSLEATSPMPVAF